MARSAILSVRILGDARSAVSAMRDTERESSRLGGALKTIGGGLAAGAAAIGAAAVGVGAGLGVAIMKAADLEQSVGAIDSVFGEFAGSMHSMSATAATDVGLTKNEFNELGTLIGTQLKNGGTAMDELAPKTNELIGVGADLASMFGGTTADAVGALSSALKGERDPIERYGVSLNQAAIDAKAAELGFEKVGNSLSAEANQAATLALIMEQTSDAHGNFAKEADTFSGQLERMRASWGNIVSTVGTAFLPMMTAAVTAVNEHVIPVIQAWAESLGEGTGLGAALQRVSDLGITVLGSLGTAFQVAGIAAAQFAAGWSGMTDGVIGSGLMGHIADLGATVRGLFDAVGAVVGPALQVLGTSFAGAAGTVLQFAATFSPVQLAFSALLPVLPVVGSILGTVAGAVLQLMTAAIPLGVQLTGVLVPVLTQVAAAVLPALLSIVQAVVGVLPAVTGLFGQVAAAVVTVISAVAPLVTQLVTGLAPIAVQLVQSVLPPVVGALMAIIPPVLALVQTLVGALVPAISALLPIVTTVFGSVAQVVTGVMQIVSGVIQTVMGVITGDWRRAWEGIKTIAAGVWNTITGLIQTAVGLVAGVITAAAGVISTVWQTLWGGVTQFFSNSWATVVSVAQTKGGELLDLVGSIPSKVKGFFSDAGSWLVSAGRNIIDGLINGAGQLLPKIGQFFLDKLPGFIREPFKQALGIRSPSRVFAGFGRNIMEGVNVGVDARARSAARTVQDAAAGIITGGRRALSGGLVVPVSAAPAVAAPSTRTAVGTAAPVTINVTVEAGVGDPVEIGREVDRVLRRYRDVMGAPA